MEGLSSTTNGRPTLEEKKAYLKRHHVATMLNGIVADILAEMPDDPVAFLKQRLEEASHPPLPKVPTTIGGVAVADAAGPCERRGAKVHHRVGNSCEGASPASQCTYEWQLHAQTRAISSPGTTNR